MLQTNPKVDPLVEILRLAYRRGLVIRKEQDKEQKNSIQVENTAYPTGQTVDNETKSAQAQGGK